jgi:heme a synthase
LNEQRLLRILAVFTSIGAYLMVLMGAIVSATESGRGCGGSWPFCHGQLIPQSMPVDTVIEYSHRIISGIDGFFILLLTVWIWFRFKKDQRAKILSGMSLFFVVLQGALGALTVVFEETFSKNFALALHFGFSLITFASVVLLTVHFFQNRQGTAGKKVSPVSQRMKTAVWALSAYTYVIVYTGALVRHTDATMACGYSFPFCGGLYLPNLSSLAGIQMLHRFGAFSLWILVLLFMILVLRSYRARTDLVRASIMALILITLQAVSGVIIILTGGKLVPEMVHSTIISVFFCVLSYLCMQVGTPWGKKRPVLIPEEGITH